MQCKVLGFPIEEENNTTIADNQFLEEIISLNEDLATIRRKEDLLALNNKVEGWV